MVNTATKTTSKQSDLLNTVASNPLRNADSLASMVSFLKGKPEFEGTISAYPGAQLLNDKSNPGLFIKQTELAKAGWYGLAHNGEEYTHTYNDGSGQPGILFSQPNLAIVAQSPRYIELTLNGEQATPSLGKAGTIVGIFADAEGNLNQQGADYYSTLEGKASLRTFYLIYLFNNEKECLHKIPFCLSVKGVAASSFGKAIQAFENAFYTYASGIDEDAAPLNQVSRSLFIWTPKFVASLEPKDAPKKSWVAIVPEANGVYEFTYAPIASSNEEFESWNKKFTSIRKANNNFASRYMEEIHEATGFHAIAAGVDVNQKALPASISTVDVDSLLD